MMPTPPPPGVRENDLKMRLCESTPKTLSLHCSLCPRRTDSRRPHIRALTSGPVTSGPVTSGLVAGEVPQAPRAEAPTLDTGSQALLPAG